MGYMYAVDGSEVYLTAVVYSRKRVNSANILSHQVYLLSPLAFLSHPRLTVTCSNNAKYYCTVRVYYVIRVVTCGVLYLLHFLADKLVKLYSTICRTVHYITFASELVMVIFTPDSRKSFIEYLRSIWPKLILYHSL